MEEMNVQNTSEKYYTVKQAAEECGISDHTIKRCAKNGELKATEVQTGQGRYGWAYRIAESDLLEWLENREKKTKTVHPRTEKFVEKQYADMTLEQLAGKLLKMVQDAYNKGYEDGKHAAKVGMLKRLNEV